MNQLTNNQNSLIISAETDFATADFNSSDLVIPKIMCMQPTSEMVANDQAKYGDFVNNVTNEVLGNIEKPIEFIPFFASRKWCVSKLNNETGKYEFLRFDSIDVKNQNLPYEDMEDGYKITRAMYRDIFCLLTENYMPCIIQFKGVSGRAGKVLMSNMYVFNTVANGGKPNPALFSWKLSGVKKSNDKGRFIELTVTQSRRSTQDEVNSAAQWSNMINGKTVVVAEDAPKTTSAVKEGLEDSDVPF